MNNPVASSEAPDANPTSGDGGVIVNRIRWCVEKISLGFGRWDDPHTRGPGLYFVVENESVTAFAEPMGTNRWPIEDCVSVYDSPDALFEAARKVAFACDGAIVVHNDGSIEEEMVRVRQLSLSECEQIDDLPYAGWMGARHMSALETSTREEVFAVITLSEEDGRMTVFRNGMFEDHHRDTFMEEGEICD